MLKSNKKGFYLGGYGGRGIPVSIPNTEVKSTCANGTWVQRPGRVGHRQDKVLF